MRRRWCRPSATCSRRTRSPRITTGRRKARRRWTRRATRRPRRSSRMNHPSARKLRERVSAEEWELRVNLAACYRLVARYGMTDLIYNHITARVPGREHHILINAYGMLYEEVTASSLIKVDLAGNIIDKDDHPYSVNAAGYIIHSAVHEARDDAQCVIHTHTPAGIAVSAMEEGLLPLSQTAMRFHGHVAYHDYEGPAFNRGEKARLVAHLGASNAMILRNHGLLVCAPSIPQAFNLIYWLEQARRIQVQILACGMLGAHTN